MGYKVAIVSDWYLPRIGGLELHLRDLARELNARGHEAHVITATPGPDELDGITVHRLDVPLMPGLDTIRSRKALRPLEALFVREQYDLVHAHTALSPLAIGATAVAKRLGIPSVMTEHSVLRGAGLALLSTLHKIWGWADWPDMLTAVSHYVAKDVRDVSGRKDVYVLPNGINPREWKSHATARPPRGADEPLRVTTVMRFTKRKKPHAVVRAIPEINALLPDGVRPLFTLVGDGPERARVEREVKRLGVESQVELTGFRPRHEIREILARSSLFILPTSKEALSIATLEARCCGLPVVAMNHGGVGDLITNGKEGFLANTRAEFIARIAEVVRDERLRRRMSEATRRSLDWFAWDSVIAQHMHVYRLAYQACHGTAPPLRVWPENEALRERLA